MKKPIYCYPCTTHFSSLYCWYILLCVYTCRVAHTFAVLCHMGLWPYDNS